MMLLSITPPSVAVAQMTPVLVRAAGEPRIAGSGIVDVAVTTSRAARSSTLPCLDAAPIAIHDRDPVQAADQPIITGVGIIGTLVAGASFPGAAHGLARARPTDTDVGPAAPGIIGAVAALIGAAGSSGRAIAVPGTDHRRIRRHALAIATAGFPGSRAAMVRKSVSQTAARGY